MSFTQTEPLDAVDIERLRYRRQWALLYRGDAVRTGWTEVALDGRWMLSVHPDARTRTFRVGERGLVSIGSPVQPLGAGGRVDGLLEAACQASEDRFEGIVATLGGCYVLVRHDASGVRLYTDPAGMAGVYYGHGRAASTPSLVPGAERSSAVDREFAFGGTDDWYPGSLCPWTGVRALLANHSLDPETGRIARFWPKASPARLSLEEGLERASSILRGMLRGFTQTAPCVVSITGGRDSRVVLAAAREHVAELEFFTIRRPGMKRCDVEIPLRLASELGLRHELVDWQPSPAWLVELYDELASGMAFGARREILGACRKLASSRYLHVNGNLGAITKSYFWPSRHPGEVVVSALAREFVQRPPMILQGLREWLATVPELPPTTVYNLMYLEQRGGRWMGIGETAGALFYESATPFCSRELFEVVCGMPEEEQYGGRLLESFVARMWPELREIPYCPVTRNLGRRIPVRWRHLVKRWIGMGA